MKGSSVFFAFLGGAIVGGALGILFAPKSGKETRDQIKYFVDDEVDQVKDFVDKNVTKAKRAVKRGRAIIEDEIANVKSAVRDEMEAVRRAKS